jgi:hypothetical protein
LSLLVSIPTLAGAAITDRRIGDLPNSALAPALVMGIASILGVLIGAEFVASINTETAKGVLGLILILATIQMTTAADHAPSHVLIDNGEIRRCAGTGSAALPVIIAVSTGMLGSRTASRYGGGRGLPVGFSFRDRGNTST